MTATIELNSARRKLQNALGDNHKSYFAHLRTWFRKKCTKEEFDVEAKKLLSQDQYHTHNEFLLAILNKCQTLANFALMTSPNVKSVSVTMPSVMSPTASSIGSPSSSSSSFNRQFQDSDNGRLKLGPIKKKAKTSKPSFEHRFSPMSPENLPNCDDFDLYDPDERNLMYAFKEPSLPDASLISGRLLIAAWDEGLDGSVNDPAASELIVAAVDQLLKNIVTSLVTDRSSFKSKANRPPYAISSVVPNPYLITTQRSMENAQTDDDTQGAKSGSDLDDSSPWELACAHREVSRDDESRVITLYDLLSTLKKHRKLIPAHSVYAINMERLLCRLSHEGHED